MSSRLALLYRSRSILFLRQGIANCRTMATVRAKLAHEDRTVAEPRQDDIHPVVLSKIERVNPNVQLYKLTIQDTEKGIKFTPGQWLDVMIPGLPKAGGFTITSTPAEASSISKEPYLELAVQKSDNPPAQWLWKNPEKILNTELRVRVGGSFTWPPPGINEHDIERAVFVAGGVGINPLISMLSHMSSTSTFSPAVEFLYSVNIASLQDNFQGLDPSKILFYERLQRIANENPDRVNVELHCTGKAPGASGKDIPFTNLREGRITQNHLMNVLGSDHENKLDKTVCFVCGPPTMTDGVVAWFERQGVRTYCEKWW